MSNGTTTGPSKDSEREVSYQVAIYLGFSKVKEPGRATSFCRGVDCENPNARRLQDRISVGNYDLDSHIFYELRNEDDANRSTEKILATNPGIEIRLNPLN